MTVDQFSLEDAKNRYEHAVRAIGNDIARHLKEHHRRVDNAIGISNTIGFKLRNGEEELAIGIAVDRVRGELRYPFQVRHSGNQFQLFEMTAHIDESGEIDKIALDGEAFSIADIRRVYEKALRMFEAQLSTERAR